VTGCRSDRVALVHRAWFTALMVHRAPVRRHDRLRIAVATIGYRGRALPGLPFDLQRADQQCRRPVMDAPYADRCVCDGWIRRGPAGDWLDNSARLKR